MHKLLLPLLLSTAVASTANAQISSTGLVAHWRFSSNVLDSSGNAHHGVPTAITYAPGRSGTPNSAAQFNGTTSGIVVPYGADMNVLNYSICAILKPTGFYTASCQASYILERVGTTLPGYYSLGFSDNAFDQGNCAAADTSLYTFYAIAGDNAPSYTSAQYTPTISTQQWYSVVATYNGSAIRMYVNGVLKAIMAPATNALGASFGGLSIGRAGWGDPQQYPWQFKGLLDDLRLYNRVLTDSEISIYHNPPVTNGIADAEDREDVSISPNPATNVLTLRHTASAQTGTYNIIDGFGRSVMTGPLSGEENQLDVSALAPGLYFIRTTTQAGAGVAQFVKQ